MKFQRKLMALAVMGFALAAPAAHAAIDAGTNSGNGELFFSIWSDQGTAATADDVSYTRDLGININDFASTAGVLAAVKTTPSLSPINLFSTDALLTSFLSAVPASAVVHWNVVGNDALGAKRFVSTAAVGSDSIPAQTASALTGVTGAINTFLVGVNSKADTQNATPASAIAVFNSNTAVAADSAFAGNASLFGTGIGGKVAFDTTGAIGAKLPFFLEYQTGTTGASATPLSKKFVNSTDASNAAYWTLDTQGNLSYNVVAVPEADTWAMFAAGLIAVGAIARRRLAA